MLWMQEVVELLVDRWEAEARNYAKRGLHSMATAARSYASELREEVGTWLDAELTIVEAAQRRA